MGCVWSTEYSVLVEAAVVDLVDPGHSSPGPGHSHHKLANL